MSHDIRRLRGTWIALLLDAMLCPAWPPGLTSLNALGPRQIEVSPFAPRKDAAFAERKATNRQILIRLSLATPANDASRADSAGEIRGATPAEVASDSRAGVSLAGGPSRSASPGVQAAQLRQTRERLEAFLKEHPRQPAVTFETKTQLARVLTRLGKLQTDMAAAAEDSSPDRGRLLGEARGAFQAAQQTWEALEKQLQDESANYPSHLDDKDPRAKRRRDLDRELMELPLEIGGAIDGRAKSYRPADKEYRELLAAAAARYHRLYAKHPTFYGGIYARMCEGRALGELGRTSEAIEAFQDIWSQVSDGENLRPIRDQTLALMLKTYSLPAVKRYPEALTLAAAWQTTAPPAEQASPAGLEVHYLAGLAALDQARTLSEDSAARRQTTLAAKSHFDFVVGHCGDLQGQAWERSAEIATILEGKGGKRGPSPVAAEGKGDSPHLCEAPFGPFRQMGAVPFFPRTSRPRSHRPRRLATPPGNA